MNRDQVAAEPPRGRPLTVGCPKGHGVQPATVLRAVERVYHRYPAEPIAQVEARRAREDPYGARPHDTTVLLACGDQTTIVTSRRLLVAAGVLHG